MASMTIRPLDEDRDAADMVALAREAKPTSVVSIPSWLHRERTVPERADYRSWVAESDGRVVGHVDVLRNFFTKGSRSGLFHVGVRTSHRRKGIGAELYDIGIAYARELGLEALLAKFQENDAGAAFASGRGFRLVRTETESAVDPRTVTELPDPAVELLPVCEIDPRLVYEVDVESTLDIPLTEQVDHIPYDEWVGHVLEHPLFTAEGSFCAMVDGLAAATAFLCVDLESGRAVNMFTGTLRAYRGRGLALAAKLAATHWAAAHGVTQIATTNDETNAAMLAINRRLGYRPVGREVEWIKEGTASAPAPPAPAT